MNAISGMEEQILEFLDGNLSPQQEEELLHRLAVSPERRTLLRQHLQVREMVSTLAKKQRLAVPAALTAGVFQTVSSMGYSGPQPIHSGTVTESAVPAAMTASAPQGLLSMRSGAVALVSLFCLLAGSGLTYYFMHHDDSKSAVLLGNRPEGITNVQTAPATTVAVLTHDRSENGNELLHATSSKIEADMSSQTNHSHLFSHAVAQGSNKSPATRLPLMDNSNETHQNSIAPVTDPVVGTKTNNPDATNTNAVNTDVRTPAQTTVAPKDAEENSPSDIRDPQPAISKPNPLDGHTRTGAVSSDMQPFSFSVRTGGGKWPGSEHGFTGSLAEIRGTYHLNDWLNVTGTFGLFTPTETGVDSVGTESDGSIDLGMKPHLAYRTVVGAELGAHFSVLEMPFDVSFGGSTDFNGLMMPRASLFTSVNLQEDLLLRVGVEGMGYANNNIGSSLSAAQAKYARNHPLLLGSNKSSEITGFIGPAIEISWRF